MLLRKEYLLVKSERIESIASGLFGKGAG